MSSSPFWDWYLLPKIDMFTFLQEVRAELLKVSWPTRNEVTRLTFVVIGISVLVGIYLGAADFSFVKLLELIVK